MSASICTLVGNCIGADKVDLAKRIIKICNYVALTVVFVIVILFLIFRYQIFGLWTEDEEVLAMGTKVLMIQ